MTKRSGMVGGVNASVARGSTGGVEHNSDVAIRMAAFRTKLGTRLGLHLSWKQVWEWLLNTCEDDPENVGKRQAKLDAGGGK